MCIRDMYTHVGAGSCPGTSSRHFATRARTPDEPRVLATMSDGGCEFSLAPSFLERALSACSLAGLGGDNRSGLNILATSPADDGNLAPATTHLHKSEPSNSPACMNGTPLYHQPNHVARSRSFAAANSNLSLPIICAYNDLKKRRALQQITRDCRLW